jgi:WD40 repeat protein
MYVFSTWYCITLLFIPPEKSSVGDLNPKRIRDFQSLVREHLPDTLSSCGASALTFSPDSSKLIIATTTAFVLVLDLVSDSTSARVLRRFDQHRHRSIMAEGRVLTGRRNDEDHDASESEQDIEEHETENRGMANPQPTNAEPMPATITRMAISPDGQWLATTDDHQRTHIFNLDSVQHHSSLPSFPQPAHALAFAPNSPSLLILGFANNSLELYDVEARQFPPWSRALCSALPSGLLTCTTPSSASRSHPRTQKKMRTRRAATAPVRTSLRCFGERRGCVRCSLLRLWDGEGLRKSDGDDGVVASTEALPACGIGTPSTTSSLSRSIDRYYWPILFRLASSW